MRALLLSLVVAVVTFAAAPADACSCVASTAEQMVRSMDVVAEAIVGPSRAEKDGLRSAQVTFVDVLRGPAAAPLGATHVQRVYWQPPDGRSCHMVDLQPGRWLLFLSWSPATRERSASDGQLVVARCDGQSRKQPNEATAKKGRAALAAHLVPVRTEADAIDAAGRAVRRMLLASLAGKPGEDAPHAPDLALDLAPPERALVSGEKDGAYIVRWQKNPPSGYAVDTEVRVAANGVTHVVRATASFSPD